MRTRKTYINNLEKILNSETSLAQQSSYEYCWIIGIWGLKFLKNIPASHLKGGGKGRVNWPCLARRGEPDWAAELPSSFASLVIPALPHLLHHPPCHPARVAWCLQSSGCRNGGHHCIEKCCLFTVLWQSCSVLITSVYVVKCPITPYGSVGMELENFSDSFSQAPANIQSYGGGHERTILTIGCHRSWNNPEYLLTQVLHVCGVCEPLPGAQ